MKIILSFLLLIFVILKIVVLSGCANIIPPTGGDRDSLPPILVHADPANATKQFKAKSITFTFDEYVELQAVQENLIVSPIPELMPVVNSKLKTVTVKILDTLEPNTTYAYNFGKSIKDINEGNVLNGFNYVFSTGTVIDTMELTGKVLLAETGSPDSTLIVMLHRSGEDSAVIKEKPRYITTLDSSGNFRFRNLAAGTYYAYALKDDTRSRRYQQESQLFGFLNEPVQVQPDPLPIELHAYIEKKEDGTKIPLTLNRTTGNRSETKKLRYTNSLGNGKQDLTKDLAFTFEHPLKNYDSTLIQLSTDSTFIPEKNYTLELDSLKKKITLKTAWKPGTLYNLIINEKFAVDTLENKLAKSDTITINTLKLSDYGSLRINFTKADLSKNPVLFIHVGTTVISSFPLTSSVFYQQLFLPGDFDLKILFDDNKNGKWDPGQFFVNRKQPEIVRPVQKKLNIRVNMDNEFDIIMPDK